MIAFRGSRTGVDWQRWTTHPVRDRGSQFLLKTLSDAYDAVWQANAATAPPPSDDPNVDVKPPKFPSR